MATLTLNVPVKEEFLRRTEQPAGNKSGSREDAVNDAIDAYLRNKELDEFFTMCDNWVAENNITKELVDEVLKEYKEEQNHK